MTELREIRKRLTLWLEASRQIHEAVPWVQQTLEQIEWQESALCQLSGAAGRALPGLEERIHAFDQQTTASLPPLPSLNLSAVAFLNTVSTSGSSIIYGHVVEAMHVGTGTGQVSSQAQITAYRELQQRQERPKRVREQLVALSPYLGDQLDRAENAYYGVKAGIGQHAAAALELRNLLGAVEGELFQKARRQPKENMTWPRMAHTLFPGVDQVPRREELLRQGRARSQLVDDLSDILKRREGRISKDLNDLWVRVTDHLYIVGTTVQADVS